MSLSDEDRRRSQAIPNVASPEDDEDPTTVDQVGGSLRSPVPAIPVTKPSPTLPFDETVHSSAPPRPALPRPVGTSRKPPPRPSLEEDDDEDHDAYALGDSATLRGASRMGTEPRTLRADLDEERDSITQPAPKQVLPRLVSAADMAQDRAPENTTAVMPNAPRRPGVGTVPMASVTPRSASGPHPMLLSAPPTPHGWEPGAPVYPSLPTPNDGTPVRQRRYAGVVAAVVLSLLVGVVFAAYTLLIHKR